MCTNIVAVILNLDKQSHLIKLFYDCLSGLVTIHTCEFSTVLIDGSIVIHNVDDWKIVSLSYLKVIRIMCRSNLYNTGTKLHINIRILYDRNLTIHQWKHQLLTFQVRISLIIRMNGYRCITKHCLWSRRSKGQILS